jgi:hypothetical protein
MNAANAQALADRRDIHRSFEGEPVVHFLVARIVCVSLDQDIEIGVAVKPFGEFTDRSACVR